MTLQNLKKIARATIPGCTTTRVPDLILTLILNQGCDDIAAHTICLPTQEDFNVVADDGTYDLMNVVTRYLAIDELGLWWNAGSATSTDWTQIYPRTMAWLKENRPNWQDLSSDDPEEFVLHGNMIRVIPAPDTALTDGFRLYFGQAPNYMSANGHYPFTGTDTEYTHLRIFDMLIIKFAEWKLLPMLNKKVKPDVVQTEYETMRSEKSGLFKRNRAVSADRSARLRGPRIV